MKNIIAPANESLSALRARIDEARGMLWRRVVLAGMGLLLEMLTIYLWGFTVLDYVIGLPVWGRTAALIGLLAALFWLNARYIIRPFKKLYAYVAAARAVERSVPELEESVSTAIEYGEKDELKALTSPGIVAALAADAVERSENLDTHEAARRGIPINWKKAGTAAAFMAAFVALAIGLPQLGGRAVERLLLPWLDVAPPSFTLLDKVAPGDVEVPRGGDLNVSATVKGPGAGSARLLWRQTANGDTRPVMFDMTVAEGKVAGSIKRSETSFEYKIEAGDARTRWYSVEVYDPPAVKRLSVTVTPPPYTAGKPVTLADDDGALRVLAGTAVEANIYATVKNGTVQSTVNGKPAEDLLKDGLGKITFTAETAGRWELTVADNRGRVMDPPLSFPITIVEDKPPVVSIVEPRQKEASVSREDTVEIKMAAKDDFALGEVGIVHNLGYEEKKIPVKRFEPGVTEDESSYNFRFPLKGLKGGEEVAYYAYATDADTKNGPKEAKSDLRFLMVYDEEHYASPESDKQKSPGLREVGNLIDGEKDSMKKTFEENTKLKPGEKSSAERRGEMAQAQQALENRVERLLDKLKETPDEQLGSEEKSHLESAAEAMKQAVEGLERGDLGKALSHEGAALRHLSDVRRIILTRNGSSPLDDAANALNNQDNAKNNEDCRNAEEAATKIPEMLNKTRDLERQLARLDEQEPKTGSSAQETPPPPEEQGRHLKKPEEEMKDLAEQAKSLANQMTGKSANASPDQKTPSQSLGDAAKNYDKAAESMNKHDSGTAKDALGEARRDVEEASSRIGASGKELARRELENAEGQARSTADKADEQAKAPKQSPAGLKDLASNATKVSQALQELSGSPFLPPDSREAAEQGARLAQEAAAANNPAQLGSRMEKAADAARNAVERMDAADRADKQGLAEKLANLATNQKELADRMGDAAQPQAGLTAEQEALADKTKEAGNLAAQLAARERELAEAGQKLADAVQSQKEAADAVRANERTTAKGAAGDAAKSLEEAARMAKDSVERSARQEMLAALQALKQAADIANREGGKETAQQAGNAPAQGQKPNDTQSGKQSGDADNKQPGESGQQGQPKEGQGAKPGEQSSQAQAQGGKQGEQASPGQGEKPGEQGAKSQAAGSKQGEQPSPGQGEKPGEQGAQAQAAGGKQGEQASKNEGEGGKNGKGDKPSQETAQSQGQQPGNKGTPSEDKGQQQSASSQKGSQGKPSETAQGNIPASGRGENGQSGLPDEAQKLVESALEHLGNVPKDSIGETPLSNIMRTAAAAVSEKGQGGGSSGTEGKPGEKDNQSQSASREPGDKQTTSNGQGTSPGRSTAQKNVDLAQRELAHAMSALDNRGAEPLEQLRKLATSIENAAEVPGMTSERGGLNGLEAALGYLKEALEKSNLPGETVKDVAQAANALREAGRLPQGQTRITGPNLLAAGVQQAARGAIEAIDRAVRERDIPRNSPEKAAAGYEEVTREYFKTLSEK